MIAVVPGDAVLVDLEPDATVRGYAGAEVRDADGDVIDALENGCSLGIGAEDSISGRFLPQVRNKKGRVYNQDP
ncbi:MAG TPA: hypothetical protein VIW78_09965 [Burkholderiales bacterium]